MAVGKALTKGLDILEALAASDGPVSFGDLRGRVNVSPASFARFLRILTDRGYASRDPSGRYRLSWRAAHVGLRARESSGLHAVARPHLEEITAATQESSELAAFDGKDFIFLDRLECPRSVVLKARPGSRYPVQDSNAIGLLGLAAGYGRGGLPEGVAEAVRETAFAEMLHNSNEVYRAAGAVADHTGRWIGCLCVAAPAFRVGRAEKRAFRGILVDHARQVSGKLGAAGPASAAG